MGVKVREKPKGSGIYYVFINYQGRRKSKKIGTNKKTACEIAEKIKAKLLLGELNVEKVNTKYPTFKECAELWLALPHDWRESTREAYINNLKKHIYPAFKNQKINQISRKDLKLFFDNLLIHKLAPGSLRIIRAPISGIFEYALDAELININPLHDLKIQTKKTKFKVKPLTEKETELLLDRAKIFMDGFYYPLMLCALRTGMRLGELKALKWKDLNFKNRQLEVKRSCHRGRIGGTKTGKRRRVDMTPHLTETLKMLLTSQKKLALKNGHQFPPWVFANKKGKIFCEASFKNALNRCLDAANLRKIRIHDLRHTYSTIRLMRGHNVGDVSYQLGHASIKMTLDTYTHWMPGKFKSEIDDLDNIKSDVTLQNAENGCI